MMMRTVIGATTHGIATKERGIRGAEGVAATKRGNTTIIRSHHRAEDQPPTIQETILQTIATQQAPTTRVRAASRLRPE